MLLDRESTLDALVDESEALKKQLEGATESLVAFSKELERLIHDLKEGERGINGTK
jgi:hypothetical protein